MTEPHPGYFTDSLARPDPDLAGGPSSRGARPSHTGRNGLAGFPIYPGL